MKEMTEKLDKIASSLEERGLEKEAALVDSVTNSIEAAAAPVVAPAHPGIRLCTKEEYAYRLDTARDWAQSLGTSVLGKSNQHVNKLAHVFGDKKTADENDPMKIVNSVSAKGLINWVEQMKKLSKSDFIPARFIFKKSEGENSKYKWDLIKNILYVLLSNDANKMNPNCNDNPPKVKNAEEDITKEAGYTIDKSYAKTDALFRSLSTASSKGFKTMDSRYNA